jgi:hypothetical protein
VRSTTFLFITLCTSIQDFLEKLGQTGAVRNVGARTRARARRAAPAPPPRRPVPPARVPRAVRAFPRSQLTSRCLERRERVVLGAARTRHTLAPPVRRVTPLSSAPSEASVLAPPRRPWARPGAGHAPLLLPI